MIDVLVGYNPTDISKVFISICFVCELVGRMISKSHI